MTISPLNTRLLCGLVLVCTSMLGLGPVPIASTLGVFVGIFRPRWFKELVEKVYRGRLEKPRNVEPLRPRKDIDCDPQRGGHRTGPGRGPWLSLMVILMVIDIGPIPVTSMMGLLIVMLRPRGFGEWVRRIYATSE